METIKNWLSVNVGQDDKLQLMRRKAKYLRARANDINSEVEYEELRPGKRIKREVENWLKDVNEVEIQLQSLEQQIKDSCKLEYGSINQASNLTEEISELIGRGRFSQGLTLYDHGSSSIALVMPDIKIKNHKYEDNKRKILSFLTEGSPISSIGVYGPGGVGKTTLLKEIHNELLEKVTSSKNIYWVSVLHGTTASSLVDKIAEAVGLSYVLDEKNDTRKASKLYNEMKRRKNDVLILDDVWEHFSLEELGIPVGVNNCKLIVATRLYNVCTRMECWPIVKVEPLCQEEAWKLFCRGLGREVPSEIKHIAQLVAAECAGLPLGIIVMAGSMRGVDDIQEWRNTLEELCNSTIGQSDMEKDVYPVLKFSYDRLKDEKLQQCFLLCSLYPKDYEIEREELIMLFRSEGLLDGIESWEKQIDKAHSMLNKLENICLLEKCRLTCVKMHNLIREMAIRITKLAPRFMIASGAKLRKIPTGRRWTIDLDKVSLMQNSLSEIQPGTVPMCPRLSTLLLQRNPFTKLPDSFFMHMNGLKFLNLSNTRMKRLPSSVSELTNMRTLLLENCSRLLFVPSLEKLTKLRELSFRFCWSLKDVPHGMTKLASIKFLDLEGSKHLCLLLGGSLSALSNLQCLRLDPDVTGVSGDEIVKFRDLERLEGCRIADVCDFAKYANTQHFQQLKCYEFVVGMCEYKRIDYHYPYSERIHITSQRIVVVCSHRLGGEDKEEVFIPPQNTQYLQIHNCDFRVKSLVDALPSLDNLTALTKILIRRCGMIEFMWSRQSCFEAATVMPLHIIPPFQNLKKLVLTDLQDFSGLVHEKVSLPQGAFSNLKILVIKFCPKIRKLFTSNLLKRCLDNLQELEVEGCDELQAIIPLSLYDEDDDQEGFIETERNVVADNNVTRLPNLMALKLRRLPKLTSICHRALLGDGSMQRIVVEYCGEIKRIFMAGSQKHHLRNLREIRVAGCQNLQEIISTVDSSDCLESCSIELPNLRALAMDDLPFLTSFFPGKLLPCCSIEHITIQECPSLRRLPLFGYEPPTSLQYIKADREWWESMEWDDSQLKELLQPFTKLNDANASSCKILKEFNSPGTSPESDGKSSAIGIYGSCCTELIRPEDGIWSPEAESMQDEFTKLHSNQIKDSQAVLEKQSRNRTGLAVEQQAANSEAGSSELLVEAEQPQGASSGLQTTIYEEIEQLKSSNHRLTTEIERWKVEAAERENKLKEEILQMVCSKVTELKLSTSSV